MLRGSIMYSSTVHILPIYMGKKTGNLQMRAQREKALEVGLDGRIASHREPNRAQHQARKQASKQANKQAGRQAGKSKGRSIRSLGWWWQS